MAAEQPRPHLQQSMQASQTQQNIAAHIVLCIEATSAMARGWAQDRELFLDPLLSAIESGKLGVCRLACVLFGTNPVYR